MKGGELQPGDFVCSDYGCTTIISVCTKSEYVSVLTLNVGRRGNMNIKERVYHVDEEFVDKVIRP